MTDRQAVLLPVTVEAGSLAVGDQILRGDVPVVVHSLSPQMVRGEMVHCCDWNAAEVLSNGMARSTGRAFYRPGEMVTRLPGVPA